MLRYNALVRVAAGAVQASSTQHVAHLTRTLNHLSLSSKLAPASTFTNSIARSFATKVVKRKTATKVKTKTAVKKKTPTETKAKKKAPVRKRKVVVKKKKAAPKKKVVTEKQKLAAQQTKARDEIKKLKETALLHTVPKEKASGAWTVFAGEKLKGSPGGVTEVMKAASIEFKALSASELEVYYCKAHNFGHQSLTFSDIALQPCRQSEQGRQ
jgi:outer membrane biosynthesis protein TonB